MSSMTFGQKIFKPTPPMKGSFPLDHEGKCKTYLIKYLECMHDTSNNSSQCRIESRDYLQCRMENGLMAKEDLGKIGYGDLPAKEARS